MCIVQKEENGLKRSLRIHCGLQGVAAAQGNQSSDCHSSIIRVAQTPGAWAGRTLEAPPLLGINHLVSGQEQTDA